MSQFRFRGSSGDLSEANTDRKDQRPLAMAFGAATIFPCTSTMRSTLMIAFSTPNEGRGHRRMTRPLWAYCHFVGGMLDDHERSRETDGALQLI